MFVHQTGHESTMAGSLLSTIAIIAPHIYECVDASAETIIGGHASQNGALFYHVEPHCGSLPCPPDDPQKEMTCAVCTR